MQIKSFANTILMVALLQAGAVQAATFYVSPSGNDANPGTLEKPFATLKQASSQLKPGDTCFLREGVYRETLTPKTSGTQKAPITFTTYKDERVILRGDDLISGWKKEKGGVYSADLPWSLGERNQLFADGQMIHEASWPALGDKPLFKPAWAESEGGSKTTLICGKIPGTAADWKGAQIWCAGGAKWICWSGYVTGYNPRTHTLSFDPPKGRSQPVYHATKGSHFVLRGVRAALKKPGQWYCDKIRKRVFLIPPVGSDMESLLVSAKRRNYAIDLAGRSYITIRGLEFCGAGLLTDDKSTNNRMIGLKGSYVEHLYNENHSDFYTQKYGVMLKGHHNLLLNCDLSYSSPSGNVC